MKLPDIFKRSFDKNDAAKLLQVRPELLDKFEQAYKNACIDNTDRDDIFGINAKDAVENKHAEQETVNAETLVNKIVDELIAVSKGGRLPADPVTNADIKTLPESVRPQLTGTLMKRDIDAPGYIAVLDMFSRYQKTGNIQFYHQFRQGLDILDLDPIIYEIIGMNRNSIGYWFPVLKTAVDKQAFFKVPETKIVKVPLPILQLTRLDWASLTPSTLDIVNKWAYKAFNLDENKKYFIKTGTYSSKYDFRNAVVTDLKEIREIGSYLLFIHFQALRMASPLTKPCTYGVSTTNEWCVREYIEDTENNPRIYKGMPLHTEYRVFFDADTKEILGIAPYWKPDIMKKRFSEGPDKDTPDMIHDYVIYKAHEQTLMERYEKNKDLIVSEMTDLIADMDLTGQWSVDVMQNGNDFYIIDMASAANSALNDCIPENKRKTCPENWIPELK